MEIIGLWLFLMSAVPWVRNIQNGHTFKVKNATTTHERIENIHKVLPVL